MQKGNTLLYWAKVVSLGLILGLGLQFAEAWTAPSALPPGGNVAGPVTTGAGAQYKFGRLGVNSDVAPINAFEVGGGGNALIGGNAYVSGNVGIGTAAPNRKLHVLFDNPNADGTNGQLVVENIANSANGVAAMNVRVGHTDATGGIQFSVGRWDGSSDKAFFGYNHKNDDFEFGTMSGTWDPKLLINGQTGRLTSDETVYASAFHDSANAGYRADPASMSIFNTLATLGSITSGTSVTAPQFCIGASCINSWPSGGGSGTVTSLSAGNGIALSPNPIVGAGTISWNHTATQNLNMNTTNRIINLAAPTGNNDAATKAYVDGRSPNNKACPSGQFVTGIQANGNLTCASASGGSGSIVAGCYSPVACFGGASLDVAMWCSSCSGTRSCPSGTTLQNVGPPVVGGDADGSWSYQAFNCIQN